MLKTRKHSVLCVIDTYTAAFLLRFSLNLVLVTADGVECNGSHPTVTVSTRLVSVVPVRKYTQWIPVSGQSQSDSMPLITVSQLVLGLKINESLSQCMYVVFL